MTDSVKKLSTGVGLSLFFGGILLFALAVPTRNGIGLELVFSSAIPGWAFGASLLGGPIMALGGAAIGIRYGNFERYHKDYDPDTGRIESDHPFAAFADRVSKEEDSVDGDHPENFVISRRQLAGVCAIIPVVILAPLVVTDSFQTLWELSPSSAGTFLLIIVLTLSFGSIVGFYVSDRMARDLYDEYP